MIVSRYGVHWAPGSVAFLLQPLGSQNLISPDLQSPFTPHIRPKRLRCPHQINLADHSPAPAWIEDPLAQVFLPTPREPGERAKVILDPENRVEAMLLQLSRLSSACEPITRPLWWRTPNETQALYGVTNLSPLVWIAGTQQFCRYAARHIELGQGFGRRVLIVARERMGLVDDCDWIETRLGDISGEPLEAIGSGILRDYMNRE